MSGNLVTFQNFAAKAAATAGRWPGPAVELAMSKAQWVEDAREALSRYRAAVEIHRIYYSHWSPSDSDSLEDGLGRLCAESLKRALEVAALAGWLVGLEVHDEIGKRLCGILTVEWGSSTAEAVVMYDNGSRGRLADLCASIGSASNHLALPGSAEIYDGAMLEALEARAGRESAA